MPASNLIAHAGGEVARDRYDEREMIDTLKQTVAKGATDAQFKMFIEVCRRTGLNPFLKEIWFVPAVGVMAGRDGYLRVANENPQFDGMETRVDRDEKNVPIKATCTVWRKDRNHPIVCEAYYSEYKKSSGVWAQYPSAMISKVAEVLALKRSFSINGVVTEEEIGTGEPRGSIEAAQAMAQGKINGTIPLNAPPVPPEPDLVPALEESIRQAQDRKASASTPAPQVPPSGPTDKFDWLKSVQEIKKVLVGIGQEQAYRDILRSFGAEKSNGIEASKRGKCYRALAEAATAWKRHCDAHQFPDWESVENYRGASPIWVNGIEHRFNEDQQKYEVVAG